MIFGGAKGLHQIMTMDASKVKGGPMGQALFQYLTLKAGANAGSHVGYEIVPTSNYWMSRGYVYTNALTYDTIYTIGNNEMYNVDMPESDPYWMIRDAILSGTY